MNAPAWIFVLACTVLAVLPWVFIYHRVYDDGLLGRLALGGVSMVACIIVLVSAFSDRVYDAGWESALLTVAFTIFLCWHLGRFHTRAMRARGGQRAPCGLRDKIGCPYTDKAPAVSSVRPPGAQAMG